MAKQAENKEKLGKLAEFFEVMGKKSTSTTTGYKSAIWAFIKFKFNLTGAEKGNCAAYVDEYFASNPDVVNDFKEFIQENLQDKAPLGALQVFNQLKNFFEITTEITLTKKDLKKLRNQLPTGGVQSEETALTTDIIRDMIQHTDIKGKALTLMLATTGMRIGEILKLKCSDVHFPTADIPVTMFNIAAKNTKNGHQRFTFCTSETTAALREWIKVRPQYLKENQNRGLGLKNVKTPKDVTDDRLFPLSDHTVNELIADMVTKVTGDNAKDENTGRSLIHAHAFRKFFISKLSKEVERNAVEFMAGHLTGLDSSYKSGHMTPADLVGQYMKGEHNLYIESPKEIREAAATNKTALNTLKDDNQKTQSQLISLMIEKDALRDKLAKQAERMAEMEEMMQAMERQQARLAKVVERYVTEAPPAPMDSPLAKEE